MSASHTSSRQTNTKYLASWPGKRLAIGLVTSVMGLGLAGSQLLAQRGGGNGNPAIGSLRTVRLPEIAALDYYVQDRNLLLVLGKALFWDMQAGSDGQTACATCHFHAGADHRVQNQLAGVGVVPNKVLTAADFPFRKFANTGNNRSAILSDARWVSGSAGVAARVFTGTVAGSPEEGSAAVSTPASFTIAGIHARQVTGRNTPSVINAVYNVRNFWDGRASQLFTGATPFGAADGGLHSLVYRDGQLFREAVRMENGSLASQSVGPVLNEVEMSWAGRDWSSLAKKLYSLRPLARQQVSTEDSVLGAYADPSGVGLQSQYGYDALVRGAFRPAFWSAPSSATGGATQMEENFSLFWGLAVQAYQATLVADRSRYDLFVEGDATAMTALEQQGMRNFQGGGSQCTQCHNGPEFSAAGYTNLARRNGVFTTPGNAGFFRIGASALEEDLGMGGKDAFGNPLFTGGPAAANGTFKTPGLRNVELTGPYFHNGSQATLDQVLDFYGRNGDFPGTANLGPGIGNIRLSQADRTAIVAFLKALTDERVRYQRAPFDHPSLCVPVGHEQSAEGQLVPDPTQPGPTAMDRWALVQAVGRQGAAVPLQTFEEMLQGIGLDGSRANTMNEACKP